MRLKMVFLLVLPILMISLACQLPFSLNRTVDSDTDPAVSGLADDPQPSATPGGTVDDDKHSTIVSGITPERALSPDHLVYLGAFRLPDDSGGMGWDYSGHGMTHFPGGNPVGRADDLPGSLFMVGHDHRLQVAEISIPNPVISKNLEDLNTAETLQPFADITGGMISDDLQIPRMGIAYLPAQQGQTGDQIHFAIGQHFQAPEIGYKVAAGLFKRKVLVAGTLISANTVRFEPALIITKAEIDEVLNRLEDTLREIS